MAHRDLFDDADEPMPDLNLGAPVGPGAAKGGGVQTPASHGLGRSIGDDDDDEPMPALELAAPGGAPARPAPSPSANHAPPAPPPPDEPEAPEGPLINPEALARIADFDPAPSMPWELPAYALSVRRRKQELRDAVKEAARELAELRRQDEESRLALAKGSRAALESHALGGPLLAHVRGVEGDMKRGIASVARPPGGLEGELRTALLALGDRLLDDAEAPAAPKLRAAAAEARQAAREAERTHAVYELALEAYDKTKERIGLAMMVGGAVLVVVLVVVMFATSKPANPFQ